ncbi:MAG: translocation/assembly module TamB domain-containing protein [Acidobacteriota bacterium]
MSSTPPRPRRRKWFFIALLSLLLLIGGVVLSAWLWLRSDSFNRYVAGEIKTKLTEYGLRGEIGSFGFAWNSQTAHLKDLKIYNQQTGQLIASVKNLELKTNISDLYAIKLSREITLRELALDGVEVFVDIDEQGKTNLEGVHNAPSKSQTLKFDSSSLQAALTNGVVHFKDRQHRIESDLNDVKINAQLSPLTPNAVSLQLTANNSRAAFEGREVKIGKLDLAARAAASNIEVEHLTFDSDIAGLKAKGKLEDFNKPRYGFDVETNIRMDELARFAFPTVAVRGPVTATGRIEGEGSKYNFKGSAAANDLTFEGTKLRGVQLPQITADGSTENVALKISRASVQSAAVDTVQVSGISAGSLAGEVKFNGKTAETRFTAPNANIAAVVWPDSKLTNLKLSNVTSQILGNKYEVKANANLDAGTISGAQVTSATAKATFDNTALTVTEIKANALGGTVEAEYTLPMAKAAPQHAKGRFANVQTAEALILAKFKDAPITGKATGEFDLNFGKSISSLDGKLTAHFDGKTSESSVQSGDTFPLTGDVAITARGGVFNFDQFQLATDATKINGSGTLVYSQSGESQSDFRVSLNSTQAEQLIQIARSYEAARPFIIQSEPQLIGDLKFEGRITGKLDDPTIEGDVTAATVGLRDALLGAFSGHVVVSPVELRVANGLITATNGGSAKLDLVVPFDPKAETGKLDATADRISLETILAAMGSPDANQFVSGDVTGKANLTGLPASPRGSAQLSLVDGRIAGQPTQVAKADVIFDNQQALLQNLDIQLPKTRITGSGKANLNDFTFEASGKADQIALDALAESFELTAAQVEGAADAQLQISGKFNKPDQTHKQFELDWESLKVNLNAIGKNIRVNGSDAGELRLTARTSPGGRIEAELTTGILAVVTKDKAFKPEIVKASIELRKPGRPIVIESDLSDLDLSPIIATFAPAIGSQVTGAISGKLRIEGLSADDKGNTSADGLRGGLTLTAIKLDVLDNPITIPTPLTIALDRSQVSLPATRITGQGIDLTLGGAIGLQNEAAMNFALNGTVNLEKLPTTQPGLFLIGEVKLDARLSGTSDKPSVSGAVDVNSFGLSTQDLPVFLSNGMGRVTLAGDQLKLERFVAEANDGRLEIDGAAKLVDLRPAEWRFNIKATEAEIFYEQFNATVNGTLTLVGTPEGQRLDGTITIPQGEYEARVDLDNLLGSGSSGLGFGFNAGGSPQSSLIPPISLNLRVEARDSLLVRSKQINAVGSALFTIGGTLSDPNPYGRIETDSGLVRFRGQRYEITRGTLDLPPGNSQSPVLDLLAETDLSGYHVYLNLSGTIDAIELRLRSEPQLTRDEIIALITTGRTETGTIASQDPLRTGFGAAASLLSSGFISKPTEQLLGLSRFQIDPILRPNANPAARLTVAQQLSRNVYLSYSTNLASEQDQTALAEYTLSNRFSALASYTQGGSAARQGSREGAFTIELRGRQRFSLGFTPPLPSVTAGTAPAVPARATLPSVPVQVSEVPKLKLSEKTLRDLLPVKVQGFSRSLARLGERRLREYLQEQGYFFAEVSYRCEPADCTGSGLRVIYDVDPKPIYDLKEIRLEGTKQISLSEVSGDLQSSAQSRVGNIPFLKDLPLIGGTVRGLTSSSRLSTDEESIRRKLVDLGFRSARVKARLAFKPDNDDLVLVFDVAEGVQSEIAGIVLRGNAVFSEKDLLDGMPIKSGEAFSLTRARLGAQQIRKLYSDRGYLEANTELAITEIDEDSVHLVYKITEGARAVVSNIEINGLTKTGVGWVRRYLEFKQGDLLTPAMITQTQRNLYSTNAFREVMVRTEPAGGDDGSAHKVTINLTEAKPLLFVYGLGFSTDDGARVLSEITDTNLGGTLDSLSLRLRGSRREQFAQFSFTDLRPFGTRFPTTISFFYNRNNNLLPIVRRRQLLNGELQTVNNSDQTFGLSRFAAFIQTERKLNERTSMRFRYNLERAKLFNLDNLPETEITRNERAIRLGMLSVGISRDTRDNVLNSTRGQLVSADYSLAASILGGNESFNKFFATYQRYKTFEPGTTLLKDTTLAFSARIGLAGVFRNADRNGDGMISDSEKRLPISERFFSGGATTLRGFRFETAGPQDVLFDPNQPVAKDKPFVLPTLIPVGGDAQAVFNFELRYPLTQRLRLVPFYDLGNVFRRASDIRWSGMSNTVGLGLRVNTPLGPVGVDYGFLLDPPSYLVPGVPGAVLRQPRGTIHIRFGQTF